MAEDNNTVTEGLIYVHDSQPGYTRRRHGRGFVYLDHEGSVIRDESSLKRLRALKIPPAWDKVWICRMPSGYLQATGYDTRQRKQYLYHAQWAVMSQTGKFKNLYRFAKALPAIRKTADEKLKLKGWPREKVLALIIRLMDKKYMRVGNKFYEEENETYGITTLRRKHLIEKDGKLMLEYKSKSGKYREVEIADSRLVKLVKESSDLPGYEIFRYLDEDGRSQPIGSKDVNDFLREITSENFTSKSFRTWSGTVLALKEWETARKETEGDKRKSLKTAIVKNVAEKLGNTPAIAEQYYIHPAVLGLISTDDFRPQKPDRKNFSKQEVAYLDDTELRVLQILEDEKPG
jgi:DNA topoisomerase I